jgi:hypothetical protein
MTKEAFAGMTKEAFAGMTKEAFAGMTKEAFAGMTRLPDAVLPSYRLPVLKSSLIGQRFCLVGANLRYREFFNLVTDEFGLPNPTVYASRNTTEIAWRAEAVKAFVTRTRPRITREIAASSQRISYFSSDKIRQALGFDFRPIDETIEWVAAEFRRAESRPQ